MGRRRTAPHRPPPISGLPEIGIVDAQVGQARLACSRREACGFAPHHEAGRIRSFAPLSQHDARIPDALIAVDQVHLLGLDLPRLAVAHDPMPGPAGQHARLVAPELADQEVRAQHAGVVASGGEHLDVGDQPHRARGRRLRPGVAGAEAVDAVLEPAAVVEHHRDLAPRVAGAGRRRHPVDTLRRVEREPVVVAQLVEQPRLAIEQHAEAVALGRVGDGAGVVLPAGGLR